MLQLQTLRTIMPKCLKALLLKVICLVILLYNGMQKAKEYIPIPIRPVNAFKNNKDKIYFVIFGGTWCEDTQFVLPKFYKIQEATGFPEDRITIYAVDRNKNTTGNLAYAMNITHTPTIVVMKDGREVGRLVEYGKTGNWEPNLQR